MVSASKPAGELLLKGELYEVRAEGRIVRCALKIPPRTAPALGANVALDMGEWLVNNVLKPRSQWAGLIVDVRLGPSVFGPVTRSAIERMLTSAQQSRKPMAVLVGHSSTQHDQFLEMARLHAPRYSRVTSNPDEALTWLTTGDSSRLS
jgi:hypothetical protein